MPQNFINFICMAAIIANISSLVNSKREVDDVSSKRKGLTLMTFTDKVKRARELCGLTQRQLAELVGVSQRTIASYESSNAKPHASTMRKLAKALMVSVDYLADENITDPTYGIEKEDYIAEARELYGNKAAAEVNALLERNAALFAGGELSQEAKDAYFEAVMKAYLACKEKARETFGRKES